VYTSLRGAYFTYDDTDEGVYPNDRYVFAYSNVGQAGVPPEFQAPSGTQNQTTIRSNTRDKYNRYQVAWDTTFFFSGGGEHQLKAASPSTGARTTLSTATPRTPSSSTGTGRSTRRGAASTATTWSAATGRSPSAATSRWARSRPNSWQIFLQDQWTIARNFTLNIGLRTENEIAPSYADPIYGYASDAIKFDFKDKLAPRVGFAWDIKGDGRWKAYASWGIFYDILKMDLPRQSFGGAKWVEYYYTLDTPNWPSLVDVPGCPPACPGNQLLFRDFRYPSNDAIDPDVLPMKMQEAVVGFDHELTNVLSLGVRYVHKQIDRAIEDIGNLDAEGNETYVIGNPGIGINATYLTPRRAARSRCPRPSATTTRWSSA